ncbi:MAG TPA: TldD/PmbA family protein [Firmicutes bacterium]|nr:TldD/PmbA family protein [Bacillota bacterium]
MFDKEGLVQVAHRALSYSQAEQTQVSVIAESLDLTRFNNNEVHQSLSRDNFTLVVKVIDKNRIGVASTNKITAKAIEAAVDQARFFASLQLPNEDLADLPPPRPIPPTPALDRSAVVTTPEQRAALAERTIEIARGANLTSSGTISFGFEQQFILNSQGVEAYHETASGFYRTIMNNGDITGYADRIIKDYATFQVEPVANEAKQKAILFDQSIDITPGEYVTIFEPVAVADLLRFLAYTSFGAAAKQEGRSFMATQMGQQVMSPSISIWDDALDPECIIQPFDIEGVPKQKVQLIDRGVAAGVVYDAQTAHRENRLSTGHAGSSYFGATPRHMLMATGDMPLEEMIRTTKRGILVTRFHYTHCPDPMRVVATGTTRDGTFLIEDGQIVARLKNLRFTDSVLTAFSRVSGISPDRRLARDWWSSYVSVLPAIRVDGFHFTGATTF